MFLSYDLPKGAPHKRVWYCVCDSQNCGRFLGPFSTHQKEDQRGIVESAGWSYQREHPMDTCEECVSEIGETA